MPNVTLRDIAAQAGVSSGTVSRALNDNEGLSGELRQHILQVADQLGYDRNKLRSKPPRRVLYVQRRGGGDLFSGAAYGRVLQGAEDCCREHLATLSLLMLSPDDTIEKLVQRHEPDLLLCAGYFEPALLTRLATLALPMVCVDHHTAGHACVQGDSLNGAMAAVRHLISAGRRRIAYIGTAQAHHVHLQRARGYRKALFEAGMLADPDLELELDDDDVSGAACAGQLLALEPRPDAVFACNDDAALKVMRACQDAGLRVPQDIAFAGYGDSEAGQASEPPLTTVHVDRERLGHTATSLLLTGATAVGDTLLSAQVMVRASSSTAPAKAL